MKAVGPQSAAAILACLPWRSLRPAPAPRHTPDFRATVGLIADIPRWHWPRIVLPHDGAFSA